MFTYEHSARMHIQLSLRLLEGTIFLCTTFRNHVLLLVNYTHVPLQRLTMHTHRTEHLAY